MEQEIVEYIDADDDRVYCTCGNGLFRERDREMIAHGESAADFYCTACEAKLFNARGQRDNPYFYART